MNLTNLDKKGSQIASQNVTISLFEVCTYLSLHV